MAEEYKLFRSKQKYLPGRGISGVYGRTITSLASMRGRQPNMTQAELGTNKGRPPKLISNVTHVISAQVNGCHHRFVAVLQWFPFFTKMSFNWRKLVHSTLPLAQFKVQLNVYTAWNCNLEYPLKKYLWKTHRNSVEATKWIVVGWKVLF